MAIDQLPENQIQKGQALVVKKNCMAWAYTKHLMSFFTYICQEQPTKSHICLYDDPKNAPE